MTGPRLELATHGPEETKKAAGAIAGLLQPGDVVSLSGDLGAGKTTFVQGAAEALGVSEPVTSPTFVLVREYRTGQLPLYHLDVYRLERLQEVLDLGLDDLLDPHGALFIEWGSVIDSLLPDDVLGVDFTLPDDDEERRLSVAGRGRSWAGRWERLEAVLGAWRAD
jgi:tRNA threonylcarbamoyladenosine biosynthesis protein TsaE